METANVSILSDVEQALNDGKTVFLKVDTTMIEAPGYVVTPIIAYWFYRTDGFSGFSAASLLGQEGGSLIFGLNFFAIFDGGVRTVVVMTIHQFVETP